MKATAHLNPPMTAAPARPEPAHPRHRGLRARLFGLVAFLSLALVATAAAARLAPGGTAVLAVPAIGIALAFVLGFLLLRSLTRPLESAARALEQMAKGGSLDQRLDTDRPDEVGRVLRALADVQARLAAESTRTDRLADESNRVKAALDNARTGMMIADNDGRIVYANAALQETFRQAAPEMRQAYPGLDPDRLIGASIDTFHRDPAHQRRILANLDGAHRATIEVAGRTFALTVSPALTEGGDRLGTCVEWQDLTAELRMQEEVSRLVQAAIEGDLTGRLPVKGKTGFMERLCRDLNLLLSNFYETLEDVAQMMGAIARGDLTVKMAKSHKGMFRELQDDLNTTVAKLTEVVGNIKQSADQIRTASSEIASGNTDLSQRTEEQAASLEETASSMEQLTSTVKQNADNARQANQLATGARHQASQGGEVVTKAIAAMQEISAASRRIADIIGVIDEIAFQTNLLALNAAVEAARAGEQGRGFAVVATEVRNLAGRSAQAAREIKALISDSVEKVESGEKLVDASGETLAQIVESIKKVTDIVAEIAAASAEQSAGIEQVNKAVMQMDEVTQQNAALVEEAAAASKSMEEQAGHLVESVRFFTIAATASGSGAATASERARVTTPVKPAEPRKAALRPVAVRPAAQAGSAKPAPADDGEWEEF